MSTTVTTIQPLSKSYFQYADHGEGLRRQFNSEVAGHEMTVMHDDGLYRHLHFRPAEGPSFYWFDLITWPGCLTITGDMGTYTFRRIEDMFEFFTGYINSGYWAEKLLNGSTGGRHEVKEHDAETFRRWLLQDFWEWSREQPADETANAWREIRFNLFSDYAIDDEQRDQCIETLRSLPGKAGDYYQDCWEADWSKYSIHFERCLAAIVAGIRTYRAHQETA